MRAREITRRSTLGEVARHPLGRDIVDRLARQVGRSPRWLTLAAGVPLRALPRLTGGRLDAAFIDTLVTLLGTVRDEPSADGVPDGQAGLREAWFKEAVFYQVYPRSFQDSDGDGIGDLRGLIARLDHLQRLGIDALWLSPIYDSPNDDNGYDIRDYRAIMTEFGSLDDFDELVTQLRARGMRLVMDLVVNHTSDEHRWFREALADERSPFREYYFLRAGTADAPPNNWSSFFSGSAWRHYSGEGVEPAEGVWALHLFSPKQMDLDWQSPALRADIVDMVRWWRARGVDGFRLDVINLISKTSGLPPGNAALGAVTGFVGLEHYFHGPRLHEHLRQLRAEAFDDPDCVAIGETPAIGAQTARLLTGDDRGELDMVFTFDHLDPPGRTRFDDYRYDLVHLKELWSRLPQGDGYWSTLFFDNHDNPRMLSKVDPRPEHRTAVAKLLATIQLTLRGTPFLYQGQEIGAVDQRFTSLAELRDVESLNLAAELTAEGRDAGEVLARVLAGSRDHARVPMAWDAGGGFTTGEPWIAGDDDHTRVNVAAQEGDPASVLEWHRGLIALRRQHRALVYGTTAFSRTPRRIWSYTRRLGDDEVLVVLNLADRPARVPRTPATWRLTRASGGGGRDLLDPYEAQIWLRTDSGDISTSR